MTGRRIRTQIVRIFAATMPWFAMAACTQKSGQPVEAPVVVAHVDASQADAGTESHHVLRLVYGALAPQANRARLAPGIADVMRRRLGELGISGAGVEAQGDRVEVRLPQMSAGELEQARGVLSRRARFEFRMVDDQQDYIGEAVAAMGGWDGASGLELQQEWVPAGPGKSITTHHLSVMRHAGESMQDARRRLQEGLKTLTQPPSGAEIAVGATGSRGSEGGWRTYVISTRAELANDEIEASEARQDEVMGGWTVAIRLTPQGASTFERVTANNIKRRMAIVVDGVVESAPVIMSAIPGGNVVITMGQGTAGESEREARQLALTLRAGALPAAVELLVEDTIPSRRAPERN